MAEHRAAGDALEAPTYRPIESRSEKLPWWVLLLSAAFLVLGAVYFMTNLAPAGGPQTGGPGGSGAPVTGGPGTDGPAPVDVAAAEALIEEGGCAQCHGGDLTGQGAFPPLTGVAEGPVSDNLQDLGAEHPEDWAQLWIHGTNEEVAGLDRRGMPTFSERFSDEEIDLIVRYLQGL